MIPRFVVLKPAHAAAPAPGGKPAVTTRAPIPVPSTARRDTLNFVMDLFPPRLANGSHILHHQVKCRPLTGTCQPLSAGDRRRGSRSRARHDPLTAGAASMIVQPMVNDMSQRLDRLF